MYYIIKNEKGHYICNEDLYTSKNINHAWLCVNRAEAGAMKQEALKKFRIDYADGAFPKGTKAPKLKIIKAKLVEIK